MRIFTTNNPSIHLEGSRGKTLRQFLAATLLLALGACSGDGDGQQGTIGYVEGFLGGIAVDEPRAALIGRDILSAGGSAADAAVAVYFALSVTMPSTASVGGGGVCVVFDPEKSTVETLDFLARAPRRIPATATRPSAVPGNPRGFFALHARYGVLRWEQLLSPAEELARFGTRVSRAFAFDLSRVERALLAQPETRRLFGDANGQHTLREGEKLVQVELASTIGRLRRAGPGDFYAGTMTHPFVEAVIAAGGSLSVEDMRGYRPIWRPTIAVPFNDRIAHFTSPPGAAGGVAAEMWRMLTDEDRYEDASEDERRHLLAETALRAFADRSRWLRPDGSSAVAPADLASEERAEALMASYRPDSHVPASQLNPAPVETLENPSATRFVVADRYGQTVSCNLSMNNHFGTGRFAAGTGVLLAAAPGPAGRGPTSMGPMIVVNPQGSQMFLAAASSGGVVAPTSMVAVAARTLLGEEPLEEAMTAKRIHHGGSPDIVFFEHGLSEAAQQALLSRGHRIAQTPALGRVNAVYCFGGLPGHEGSCATKADLPPRGYGLSISAD